MTLEIGSGDLGEQRLGFPRAPRGYLLIFLGEAAMPSSAWAACAWMPFSAANKSPSPQSI